MWYSIYRLTILVELENGGYYVYENRDDRHRYKIVKKWPTLSVNLKGIKTVESYKIHWDTELPYYYCIKSFCDSLPLYVPDTSKSVSIILSFNTELIASIILTKFSFFLSCKIHLIFSKVHCQVKIGIIYKNKRPIKSIIDWHSILLTEFLKSAWLSYNSHFSFRKTFLEMIFPISKY